MLSGQRCEAQLNCARERIQGRTNQPADARPSVLCQRLLLNSRVADYPVACHGRAFAHQMAVFRQHNTGFAGAGHYPDSDAAVQSDGCIINCDVAQQIVQGIVVIAQVRLVIVILDIARGKRDITRPGLIHMVVWRPGGLLPQLCP